MILLLIGLVLLLVAVFLGASVAFRIKIGPINLDVAERPTLVQGTWALIALCAVAGVVLLGIGAWLQVEESETRREIARATALKAIDASRKSIESVVGDSDTAASPTPGASSSPDELFAEAFRADEAGRNDEAIALYGQAISAGIKGDRLELAHLEIGLLEVVEISELDPETDEAEIESRCQIAQAHYESAITISASATAEHLRSAIDEACGGA